MVPLINILLGEVVFGGVGAGLYGMVVFVIITVFMAGLMVGRTPEYLGKKIEAYDVKMAMLSILVFPITVLSFAAIASVTSFGQAGITNPGPHGLTQILYAYTSAAGNNGSAFAGINANTPWYNNSLAVAMLRGDVEVGNTERTEQPLVADAGDEVGPKRGDVERKRADLLTRGWRASSKLEGTQEAIHHPVGLPASQDF